MKIAYNDCFGEFGLSTKGVLLGRKLSGNNKWGGVSIIGDKCPGEEAITYNCDACFDHSEREDETLIQVIEALGIEANGEHADLHIEEIPDGSIYEIEDSHGYEEVVPPREKGWK